MWFTTDSVKTHPLGTWTIRPVDCPAPVAVPTSRSVNWNSRWSITSPVWPLTETRSPGENGRRQSTNPHPARFTSGSRRAIAIPAERRPRNVPNAPSSPSQIRTSAKKPRTTATYVVPFRHW